MTKDQYDQLNHWLKSYGTGAMPSTYTVTSHGAKVNNLNSVANLKEYMDLVMPKPGVQ